MLIVPLTIILSAYDDSHGGNCHGFAEWKFKLEKFTQFVHESDLF